MSAPEHKYSDEDVRRDPELVELAYEYLDSYGGDFEPLVRAQSVLSRGGYLTTSQTRVVLNCMRHDWDVADKLPTPLAKVIDMPVRDDASVHGFREPSSKKRKKRPSYDDLNKPCGSTDLHRAHNYTGEHEHMYCEGLNNGRPFSIELPARIKAPYVMARQGKFVHLVAEEGSYFRWHPNSYGTGYRHEDPVWTGTYARPELVVNLVCRFPSWIGHAILFADRPRGLNLDLVPLCKHCERAAQA